MIISAIFLFVYGTLRQHEHNHHYLNGAMQISKQCRTEGQIYDTGYGYPTMITEKGGQVFGELYQLTEQQLAAIDQLEDCRPDGRGEYKRILQHVYTEDGKILAFVYVATTGILRRKPIESGDWCRRE